MAHPTATKAWIVQDCFSSGTPGPGFTTHDTEEEAKEEARERDALVLPYRECETCGSALGLQGLPLQGGCNYCR